MWSPSRRRTTLTSSGWSLRAQVSSHARGCPQACLLIGLSGSDRLGEYEMKLMDIDQEHLGIPDTEYDATITMSSNEFARICRDLSALGESVRIDASKSGVKFSAEGDAGSGSVMLKQSKGRDDVKGEAGGSKAKKRVVDPDDDEDVKPNVDEEDEEEEEEGEHMA